MASRNFWTIQNGKIAKGVMEFKWEPGMSTAQKTRSCKNLHNALLNAYRLTAMDISSASPTKLGKALSAFNLMYKGYSVESWYQGSKVYKDGTVSHDLYGKDSLTCKLEAKKRGMCDFVGFNYKGTIMPTEPRTVFYDWLYLNAMVDTYGTDLDLSEYDAFTDVQAVLDIDACQARSVCIYKLLQERLDWDLLEDINVFKTWHEEMVEESYVGESKGNESVQDLGNGIYYIAPNVYDKLLVKLNRQGEALLATDRKHEYRVIKDRFILHGGKTCVIYTDVMLDDLCALEVLSKYYDNALVVMLSPDDVGKSVYSPKGFTVDNVASSICNSFKNVKVITVPVSNTAYLETCDEYDVFSLGSAAYVMGDIAVLKPKMNNLVAMIGSREGDGTSEWNASLSVEAYMKLKTFMGEYPKSHLFTSEDCDELYDKNHYWGKENSPMVKLYEKCMRGAGESVTCYDLQAVCSFLSDIM